MNKFLLLILLLSCGHKQVINKTIKTVDLYEHISDKIQEINSDISREDAYLQSVAIVIYSKKYSLEWQIVFALMASESKFDQFFHRIYDSGKYQGLHDGYGVLQVLLSTANAYEVIDAVHLTSLSKNMDIGLAFFRSLLIRHNYNLRKAVLSYKRWIYEKNWEEEHWVIFNKYYKKIKENR